MATPASSVVKSAATILQDLAGVRWPATELVEWLNAGQREIQVYRPDATMHTLTGTLQSGDRQVLSAISEVAALKPLRFLGIRRNKSSASQGGAVTEAARAELDAVDPNWAASPGAIDIEHFMFDKRDQLAFYVYPPASPLAKVELMVSVAPDDVPVPSGVTFATVTGNISVPDNFASALVDYVLHRAFLKDTEFSGDVGRATAHYNAFGNALSIELRSGLIASSGDVSGSINQ